MKCCPRKRVATRLTKHSVVATASCEITIHYSDVTWAYWRLKSAAPRLVVQEFVQTDNKGNTKAPHH